MFHIGAIKLLCPPVVHAYFELYGYSP